MLKIYPIPKLFPKGEIDDAAASAEHKSSNSERIAEKQHNSSTRGDNRLGMKLYSQFNSATFFPKPNVYQVGKAAIFLLLVLFCLVFHGALPYWGAPTQWQVIWSMGFSDSMAKSPISSLYSTHFGLPGPTPAPFGLSGIWPASLLIRLGVHPVDSYSFIVGGYCVVAFCSCFRIAKLLGASFAVSAAAAVLWLTLPFHHLHAQLSFVAVGMMLLPFYLYVPVKIYIGRSLSSFLAGLYVFCGLVSVFMDGYSFVMFATGASIFIGLRALSDGKNRRWRSVATLGGLHVFVFTLSYLLYVFYLNGFDLGSTHDMRITRSNGMDFSSLFVPARGNFFLFDYFGISEVRSYNVYFSGAAASTPFALPLLGIAMCGLGGGRKIPAMIGFSLCGIIAFYFAAGPEFKFFTKIPSNSAPGVHLMERGMGVFQTGSEWVYQNVVGFKSIRYPYRWAVLGLFCVWLITVAGLAGRRKPVEQTAVTMCMLLAVAIMFPNLERKLDYYETYRERVLEIDADLVFATAGYAEPHERVLLLPTGVDDLANYWAPRANFRTYNVGGDKNTAAAKASWPPHLTSLKGKFLTPEDIISALLLEEVDVVFLHYMDLRLAAHYWTCRTTYSKCPATRRDSFAPLVEKLSELPFLKVQKGEYFATFRLDRAFDQDDIWLFATGLETQFLEIQSSPAEAIFLLNPENCDLYAAVETEEHRSGCNDWTYEVIISDHCFDRGCEAVFSILFQLPSVEKTEVSIEVVIKPGSPTIDDWPEIFKETILIEEQKFYKRKTKIDPDHMKTNASLLVRVTMKDPSAGLMLSRIEEIYIN